MVAGRLVTSGFPLQAERTAIADRAPVLAAAPIHVAPAPSVLAAFCPASVVVARAVARGRPTAQTLHRTFIINGYAA